MSNEIQSPQKDPVERFVEAAAIEMAVVAAFGFVVAGPVGAVAAVKACGIGSAINAACNAGSGG